MKKMIVLFLFPLLISGLLSFSLSSCSLFRVHKADIEQGNVFTAEDTARLRPGMTEAQVEAIMGAPVLINVFTSNRLEYVYTFKAGYGQMLEKRITVVFVKGKVSEIKKS